MALVRRLVPELLDELPPRDPRAVRSRRDLRRVHRLMGTRTHLGRALDRIATASPLRLVELGAGDGSLALALARGRSRRWPPAELVLLDLRPVVDEAALDGIRALGWSVDVVAADALEWLGRSASADGSVVFSTLFVHHFEGRRLAELLRGVARRARGFVCFEPRRSRTALVGSRLLGLAGCGAVTRHDAVASVHAGFRDAELSAVWEAAARPAPWVLHETPAGPFGHLFLARAARP